MDSTENKPNTVSRRGFLIAITGSAVAAAVGCRPEGAIAPTPYVPGSGSAATAVATRSAAAAKSDATYGTVSFDNMITTTTKDLYITQYADTPQVDIKTWKLAVNGLVENPITLDYEAIKKFPVVEDLRTLECIGNPVGGGLIGNVKWKGFAFSEILNAVKVKSNATHLKFSCADGYQTSVELKWVQQAGTMLAYEMNGEPLTADHGFPLRIHTPGLYGQKMPRWITELEFIDSYFKGFWESQGWSDVASVQTNSIIKTPSNTYNIADGASVYLQGVAFAGTRQIVKVEVQVEGSDWMPATLTQDKKSPLAWTQWYIKWTPAAPGTYVIRVRATDDTGFVQTKENSPSYPNGTDAIHKIVITSA